MFAKALTCLTALHLMRACFARCHVLLLVLLLPTHFHLARDNLNGELGFLAALGCFFICPFERVQ